MKNTRQTDGHYLFKDIKATTQGRKDGQDNRERDVVGRVECERENESESLRQSMMVKDCGEPSR